MKIIFKNTKPRQIKKKSRHKKMKGNKYTGIKFTIKVKKLVHQIRLLVGMTEADFNLLYVRIIKKLFRFYRSLVSDILQAVIRALKRRRGYLLPVGSDSEVSFREHEVWTYAVFTATVLQCLMLICPDQSIEHLKNIIPSQGLLWLKRHSVLIEQWNAYLLDHDATVFAELIHIRLEKEDESESISFSSF